MSPLSLSKGWFEIFIANTCIFLYKNIVHRICKVFFSVQACDKIEGGCKTRISVEFWNCIVGASKRCRWNRIVHNTIERFPRIADVFSALHIPLDQIKYVSTLIGFSWKNVFIGISLNTWVVKNQNGFAISYGFFLEIRFYKLLATRSCLTRRYLYSPKLSYLSRCMAGPYTSMYIFFLKKVTYVRIVADSVL